MQFNYVLIKIYKILQKVQKPYIFLVTFVE